MFFSLIFDASLDYKLAIFLDLLLKSFSTAIIYVL